MRAIGRQPRLELQPRAFGARETFFVTNGTSTANKIVSQALIQPGDIVLFQTGNDQLWRTREYYSTGPGGSAAATHWLIDQGVSVMGIDSWGWDAPLAHQAKLAKETGRSDVFWEAHYVGVEKEYCHMERLANLDALPPTGFRVCAFPLKVKGGSAGPARIVALVDE